LAVSVPVFPENLGEVTNFPETPLFRLTKVKNYIKIKQNRIPPGKAEGVQTVLFHHKWLLGAVCIFFAFSPAHSEKTSVLSGKEDSYGTF